MNLKEKKKQLKCKKLNSKNKDLSQQIVKQTIPLSSAFTQIHTRTFTQIQILKEIQFLNNVNVLVIFC